MQNRNISDIIEQYLKSILKESPSIEIKRSEIAQQFDCVPSITETDAFKVVQALYENHFLNRREANLILSTFNRNVLAFSDHEIEDIVRARILKSVINRLKCAD